MKSVAMGADKVFRPGEDRVFVFGSNLGGLHAGGAAAQAHRAHGAVWGQGEGLQGNSYALPTLDEHFQKLSLAELRTRVSTFLDFARSRPELEFFVTRVGCGIAGFTDAEVGPMFAGAPDNVELPYGWGV